MNVRKILGFLLFSTTLIAILCLVEGNSLLSQNYSQSNSYINVQSSLFWAGCIYIVATFISSFCAGIMLFALFFSKKFNRKRKW